MNRHYKYNHSVKGKRRLKRYVTKLRALVLNHYGTKCSCCNEDTYEFLSLDHIDKGRGNPAIRHGIGITFYRWLINNNFPSGIQVLCHNCNLAKSLYSKCPHKRL